MDLDIIPYSYSISILIALVIILTFFASEKKVKPHPDYDSGIPVIEVVKALEKVVPIGRQSNWDLFPFDHGCHRCWSQSLSLPFLQNSIYLYGSVAKITSSSENVCSLIANVTKWPEWNPLFSSQYIMKPFHDKPLRKDNFMEAERVISIIRETNKIQSDVFMYRFHHLSENKVGWILLWNPKKLEFFYFLMQPIKDQKENSACLLTHIVGTKSKLSSSYISLVSQRLRNIQDFLTLSSLHLVPSLHSSQKHSPSEEQSHQLSSANQELPFSLSSVKCCAKEDSNTMFILVPFIKFICQVWKTTVEYKLAVKNIELTSSQKTHPLMTSSKGSLPDNKNISKHLRRTLSDVGLNFKTLANLNKYFSSTTDEPKDSCLPGKKINSESKNIMNKNPKEKSELTTEDSDIKSLTSGEKVHQGIKLRSLSETAVSKQASWKSSSKSMTSESDCESFSKLEDVSEVTEEKLLALDKEDNKEMFHSSMSEDFEVIENCEFSGL